jgi:hypothetical protein
MLRAPPPPATLDWLLDTTAADRVTSCDPMPGGTTSAMHRVVLQHANGTTQRVVLRRYVLDSYLTAEPHAPHREADALELAATTTVTTPGPIAADLDATATDTPTIAMSDLDGQPRSLEPPRWAHDPAVWERAIEIFHDPIPDTDQVFVHRDFHPGNVLWHHGQLTGVVDWQAACGGPASIDIAHCRLNLTHHDPDLAERLGRIWEHRTGRTFDPWADIMTIIGSIDSLRDTPPNTRARNAIDHTLTAAVANLT